MSASPSNGKFQDHYSILGVETTADSDKIHKAYTTLAERYHPRNSDTRNQEKYEAVTLAYEVLSDPEARRAFDSLLPQSSAKRETATFSGEEFFGSIQNEHFRRMCVLCLLYDRRRLSPSSPAIVLRELEAMVAFSPGEVQFSLWYLKQRGHVVSDDKSSLQITAEGMEYVESNIPLPERIYPLLKPASLPKPESKPSA
ncbi:MAG: DnaJ domain-containing protein [Acidobacteria bacterium]|nr:DnaJ domain-containing protein [Acidobacteriota bacterium]